MNRPRHPFPRSQPRPGLGLTKAAHLKDVVVQNGVANLGDIVTWTFTVVNTGNVTLTDIARDGFQGRAP